MWEDIHLFAIVLSALRPLQPDRPQPGAAALLSGTLFLGSRGARCQRSRSRGRSFHATSLVSQLGFVTATVFIFATHDAHYTPAAPGLGNSLSRLIAVVRADSIPVSPTLLAP